MNITCTGRILRWTILLAAPLAAERLAVQRYTIADGLVQDGAVQQIFQDSKGLLWFVVPPGISRFDGYSFRSYGAADGLEDIEGIAESPAGDYWLATGKGLAHYRPDSPGKLFQVTPIGENKYSNNVNAISADGVGGLWLGTQDGLFHAHPKAGGVEVKLILRPNPPPGGDPPNIHQISRIFRDSQGAVWATASYCGVYRILPGGSIEHYTVRDGLPPNTVGPFLEDRRHRLWLSTPTELLELDPSPRPERKVVLRRVDTRFDAKERLMLGIAEAADGRLWIASHAGLLEYDGEHLRRFTTQNGLTDNVLWSVLLDRQGDLWVGTGSTGVIRIPRRGFTTYDESDGLASLVGSAMQTVVTPKGEVVIVSGTASQIRLWDGAKFLKIQPHFAPGTRSGWGHTKFLRDHLGETWTGTLDGLFRFPRTESTARLDGKAPAKVYTTRDGLPSNHIYTMYEDRRGDIWIGTIFPTRFGIARWNRQTDRIEDLAGTPGIPANRAAASFLEDREGTLWIGFWQNGLVRYRDGRFESIAAPQGPIESLYLDSSGAVWGTAYRAGLFRIEEAASKNPHIRLFGEGSELGSSVTSCVVGDSTGRVYVGTLAGVFRLDPATNETTHFTTRDGLASNLVDTCSAESSGHLWFGTAKGVSSLLPPVPYVPESATVRIQRVQLADKELPLSDLGTSGLYGPDLEAGQNRVEISFSAVDSTGILKYRYKLDGADRDWSQPSALRTVVYHDLRPGQYQFQAQAFAADALPGIASFAFFIRPPVWQRWWFLTLAVLALAAMVYAAYRYRLEQLLHVERVRNRIATDLHDDIGSALSQIALLSEVARRAPTPAPDTLERIGAISRETSVAMSDIVWTIDPERESLGDLARRIHRFGTEMCSASDIACECRMPESSEDLHLEIEVRRELLLAAKEAIHNAVRHARATRVAITFGQKRGLVVLQIEDNGIGFDPEARVDGHGLASMRARAARLGGSLEVHSAPGSTRLEFRTPA